VHALPAFHQFLGRARSDFDPLPAEESVYLGCPTRLHSRDGAKVEGCHFTSVEPYLDDGVDGSLRIAGRREKDFASPCANRLSSPLGCAIKGIAYSLTLGAFAKRNHNLSSLSFHHGDLLMIIYHHGITLAIPIYQGEPNENPVHWRPKVRARDQGERRCLETLTALHRHGMTYKVLFEHVFLKVLGYEGGYIDRATLGFPLRNLDDSVGDEGAGYAATSKTERRRREQRRDTEEARDALRHDTGVFAGESNGIAESFPFISPQLPGSFAPSSRHPGTIVCICRHSQPPRGGHLRCQTTSSIIWWQTS
jgi:hypothetical protein